MEEFVGRFEYCFDLMFMNVLFGFGYEFFLERELMVEKKLRGVEFGWVLGVGLVLVEKVELICIV